MIGFYSIKKRNFLKIKIDIYCQAIKKIQKVMFKSHFLYIVIWLGTNLKKKVVKDILIIYAEKNIQ